MIITMTLEISTTGMELLLPPVGWEISYQDLTLWPPLRFYHSPGAQWKYRIWTSFTTGLGAAWTQSFIAKYQIASKVMQNAEAIEGLFQMSTFSCEWHRIKIRTASIFPSKNAEVAAINPPPLGWQTTPPYLPDIAICWERAFPFPLISLTWITQFLHDVFLSVWKLWLYLHDRTLSQFIFQSPGKKTNNSTNNVISSFPWS